MSQDQFLGYRETAEQAYAENITASGMLPKAEALTKATADFSRLLPDGRDTDNQHFWVAVDGDHEVGMLWLAITERSDGLHAFGYDFLVHGAFRRRGYGRAMLAAAEQWCRTRGVVTVGLSVFGANAGAQTLYEALGFKVTMLQMTKTLT